MARLIFGMSQSLDGYVAGPAGGPRPGGTISAEAIAEMPPPDPIVFSHFTEHVRGVTGMLYGTTLYEIMRYWEEDHPEWEEHEHAFAAAWRPKPKWVASRSLKSVGPNATLIQGDVIDFARKLKSEQTGNIDVAGPQIANVLSAAGLIDEYRLYLRPYVLGGGTPFFAGPVSPLRLMAHDLIGENVIKLTYTPT